MDIYSGYGQKTHRHGRLASVFNLIMLVLTIFLAVLLICAYLAKYTDPAKAWFFAFLGLGAPIVFVLNLLMLLFWIVKWKAYVIIPFAAIIVGIGNVSLFFRPAKNAEPESAENQQIVFMTYNVMGFMKEDKSGELTSGLPHTAEFINEIDPDILCFQEYETTPQHPKKRIDSLLNMRYDRVHYKLNNSSDGGWGLAIYSKYPIIGDGTIDYPNSQNSTMWADILINNDTLRIFNNHLQTTSVDREDRNYINNQEFLNDTEDREAKVRSIAGKLRRGFAVRARQADSLAVAVTSSPYKVIVCGDFNDTPLSYAYNTIRGDLNDAFVEKGAGMSNTYKGLFDMFRIDYVLYSEELRILSYDSPENEISDHKPVVVAFDIQKP